MTFLTRTRAVAAVVVAAAVGLITVPETRPVAAQPPAAGSDLKKVPTDAALFVHVNVAEVWDNKLGETLRSAKAVELEKGLGKIKEATGMTPDQVKTVTFFFPKMK